MLNKRKLAFLPVLVLSVSVLTGCNLEAVPDGTSIMTAINYQSGTRMIYDQDEVYETPGGKNPSRKVSKGDYKPVFQYIQNKLNITLLEHQAAANSGEKKSVAYFRDNWLNKPYADISMGTVDAITKYSVQGNRETIMDLKPYLFDIVDGKVVFKEDSPMPHLRDFFKNYPGLIRSMMTAKHSHPDQGAIYYAPYCDGFQDLERLTMVRGEFIKKLLDGDSSGFDEDKSILGPEGSSAQYKLSYTEPFDADKDGNVIAYDVNVPVGLPEGGTIPELKTIKKLAKDADGNPLKNIIVQQKDTIEANEGSSKNLVNQFKTYVDNRYGKPTKQGGPGPFENYSDLFLRYDACYDPDELVALMRIVKVSPKSLGLYYYESEESTTPIAPKEMVIWFPKECDNSCSSDLYRWAGNLFGVRGPESRTGYLYLNGKLKNGIDKIHDCRGDKKMELMIRRLNQLYKEGLILKEFDEKQATGGTGKFGKDLITNCKKTSKLAGFMGYGTAASDGSLNLDDEHKEVIEDYAYRPIVGAVSKWDTDDDNDPKNDVRMQFTESWISIRTSGLCLNADLVKTPKKMDATFRFLDFMYSPLGQSVYNFGPEEDGYIEPGYFDENGEPKDEPDEGSYVEYKGVKIPKFTEAAIAHNKKYDGFLRKYVGATIPMAYVKTLGSSYQLTAKPTQEGIDAVNAAILAGSFRHPCVDEIPQQWKEDTEPKIEPKDEPFYKIVPSSFCLTKGQLTAIAALLDKTKLGSMFTDNRGTDSFNIWDGYVMGVKKDIAPELDNYLTTVNGEWQLPKLVTYYQDAYEYLMK